jgi:hypothetical protein
MLAGLYVDTEVKVQRNPLFPGSGRVFYILQNSKLCPIVINEDFYDLLEKNGGVI